MGDFFCRIWTFLSNLLEGILDFIFDVIRSLLDIVTGFIEDVVDAVFGEGGLSTLLLLAAAGIGLYFLMSGSDDEDKPKVDNVIPPGTTPQWEERFMNDRSI